MAIIPVKGRKNTYDVIVWFRDHPGPDGRHREGGRRVGLRAAKKLEHDMLKARDEGRPTGKPPTFHDFARRYFNSRSDISAKTAQTYQDLTRWHIEPALGDLLLTQITQTQVMEIHTAMRGRGLSEATVRHTHRVLSMILDRAVADGYLERNPAWKALSRPHKAAGPDEPARDRGLEPAYAQALLRHLAGTAVEVPARLALATALRKSEVLALTWENVDFDALDKEGRPAPVIRVRASLEQVRQANRPGEAAVQRVAPKSPASVRDVPLSAKAVVMLRHHKAAQAELKLKYQAKGMWRDEGLVFPITTPTQSRNAGRMWSPDSFAGAWRKALRQASERARVEFLEAGGDAADFVPYYDNGVTFHQLRHTAVSTWRAQGVPLAVVSKWCGHSSPVVTAGIYEHAQGAQREGIEATDALI